jgi:hypothetical protein
MTTESMQPQPELGPAAGSAPAQSQGHRRRRRRRKNKSSQQGAAQPQAQQQAQQPPPQAAPPAPAPPPPPQKRAQGQQRDNRKKKKFIQKAQAPAPSPGNSIAPRGQNKRRTTRQKGPREFVGPMDHRYRAANGNSSDGPPSTIPVGGNHRSGAFYADAYMPQQAPAVREDAPLRIYCFIEDLFFTAKIQETARKLGVKVEFAKGGDKETVARLIDLPESPKQMLMVFDLNNLNAKPMTLIPKFKSRYKKAVSIIGFLNHLQGDLKMKALESGCDTVMPRSAFSQSLPVLLRRYGVEEEEDDHVRQPM